MIHVLTTALVTQRISEEISGAGYCQQSGNRWPVLPFSWLALPPRWLSIASQARRSRVLYVQLLQSPFHSSLLPASFLQPFFSSSQQFNIHFSPNFLHISPGIGTDAIMGLFRNRWHRSRFRASYKKIQCRPGPSPHSPCTFQRLCQSTAIRRQSIENLLTQILKFHSEATGKIS